MILISPIFLLIPFSPFYFSMTEYDLLKFVTPSRIKSFICWNVPSIPIEKLCRLFHKDHIFTIENNIKMFLPCKHDYVQTEILMHRQFFENTELRKIHKYVSQGMTFLDVGANIGNHSLYFSSVLKAKKIYSFEPMPLTYSILKKNISLNKLEGTVTLFECGLESENTKAEVIIDGLKYNNLGGTNLAQCETGDLEIRKLDNIFIPEKIDFIKIDVERMEAFVLKGARETISREKPVIWIEIFDEKYNEVSGILADLGYKQIEILSENNYIFKYVGGTCQ